MDMKKTVLLAAASLLVLGTGLSTASIARERSEAPRHEDRRDHDRRQHDRKEDRKDHDRGDDHGRAGHGKDDGAGHH